MNELLELREALEIAALESVAEHPGVVAGSVLRCFARAVRVAHAAGVANRDLPGHAALLTAQWLRARGCAAAVESRAA